MNNTYWNNSGKHQELYNTLQKELVPGSGYAATTAGEMLRVVSNVYYDVYNNGGGNLGDARKDDLCQLLIFLKRFGFSKLYLLEKFFKNFEKPEDNRWWGGNYGDFYSDGCENFDELFTEEVELVLEEATDLIIVEAHKLVKPVKVKDEEMVNYVGKV